MEVAALAVGPETEFGPGAPGSDAAVLCCAESCMNPMTKIAAVIQNNRDAAGICNLASHYEPGTDCSGAGISRK